MQLAAWNLLRGRIVLRRGCIGSYINSYTLCQQTDYSTMIGGWKDTFVCVVAKFGVSSSPPIPPQNNTYIGYCFLGGGA